MAEKQECLHPRCRCFATTDTDSDSSLWGDSDSEWHEVPEGEFMSPEMTTLQLRPTITVDTNTDSDHDSDDDFDSADLVDIPASALGSSADYAAYIRAIPSLSRPD